MKRAKQWIEQALENPNGNDTGSCLRAALTSIDDFRTKVEAMRDEASEGVMMSIAESIWKRRAFEEVLNLIDAEQNPLEEK